MEPTTQTKERYYYKKKGENYYLSLKSALPEDQLADYDELDEETYNEQTKVEVEPYEPTASDLRKEEIRERIVELKGLLASTDYKAIKYAEGEMDAEEYAPTKIQRASWRAEINSLEAEQEQLEGGNEDETGTDRLQ